ncbi:MAG: hypothetical protein HY682_12780 [Chloroflexi bacterium]|nr:hypothetical protein [Chloroflexota bacterium]
MKTVIVVPSIREDCIQTFLEAWKEEFTGHQVIVVEDNPTRTFRIRQPNVLHFSWTEIDAELGARAWIIPRRTDCVRSFGYYKAYQAAPDMVVTLDDDCYPLEPGFLKKHSDKLAEARSEAWVSTIDGITPRGVPYYQTERVSECVLNHGLWENVPDLDAVAQLSVRRYPRDLGLKEQVIPRGVYFPMCGMNLAFRPKLIPALYFLLMGRDYAYDRFGDIWAGVFVKKICDHLGYAITSGSPAVNHKRASSVWANLRKEAPGLEVNESLWQAVDAVVLTGDTIVDCYRELVQNLAMKGDYWDTLKHAMIGWTGLFT